LEGITANIRKELNTDMPIIATGGLSNLFHFEGSFINHFDDNLTLKGVISFQNRVVDDG
jgi:type III pantothenate kinase